MLREGHSSLGHGLPLGNKKERKPEISSFFSFSLFFSSFLSSSLPSFFLSFFPPPPQYFVKDWV